MFTRYTSIHISALYLLIFFGLGGMFPLLALYLAKEVQLSGTQIGVIMSIGPIVMMVSQTLWGLACDYTRRPRSVLILSLLLTGGAGLLFLVFDRYEWLVLAAAFLAVFQGGVIPVSDSLTLTYVKKTRGDYGNYRLWGALGFALAAYVMGVLSDHFGLYVIFYGFAASFILSSLFASQMPRRGGEVSVNLRHGLHRLIGIPRLMLFLLATFLVFGPIHANNAYFGLLYEQLGGTVAGVGLAFLLAAGTEAPFMKFSGPWIRRWSLLAVTVVAAVVSGARWVLYFFEPSLFVVMLTTLAQGFSVGLFIPAALQYVRDTSPDNVQATAVGLYASVGNGLGNWFCTFLGGILIDVFGIFFTYLVYGWMTFLGVAVLFVVIWLEKSEARKLEPYA